MRRIRLIWVFVALLPTTCMLHAGGYPAAFLQYPVAPKIVSMGGSFVALADEPSGMFWNPAGTSELESNSVQIAFSHMTLDRTRGALAISLVSRESYTAISLGVNYFGVDSIIRRDQAGNPLGTFGSSELALFFSIASSMFFSESNDIFMDIGLNIKFLFNTLDDANAKGYSFDIGTIVDFYRVFRLGFALYDPIGKIKWSTGQLETMAPRLRAGGAIIAGPLTLTADADYNSRSGRTYIFSGIELAIINLLKLRTGYNTKFQKFAFGIGFKLDRLSLDYSYSQDRLMPSKPLHTLGLRFAF